MIFGDREIHKSKLLPMAVLIMTPAICAGLLTVITNTDKNHIITSLLLSLLMCFVYVIALYIVVMRMQEKSLEKSENNVNNAGNKVIASIYVIRYAVRLLIIMYFLVKACRTLMLDGYNAIVILLPITIVGAAMGAGGLHKALNFYQVVFITVIVLTVFIGVGGLENFSLTNICESVSWESTGSLLSDICSVMKRGYLFFLAFAMIEFVVFIYAMVSCRKRSMLMASVGTALIWGIIACVFVIGLLGLTALKTGRKNILHVVGALKFPFTGISHFGLPICILFVISVICIMSIHFVFIGGITSYAWKGVRKNCFMIFFTAILLILYPLFERIIENVGAYRMIVSYMGIVDIPLSIIAPAFSVRRRLKLKETAAMIIGCFIAVILTGCGSIPMEDVDYLTVIAINGDEDGMDFTFVADTIEGGETMETLSYYEACTLKDAIEAYDKEHVKAIDSSHTEYIVCPDMETFDSVADELNQKYAVSYVEVIIDYELSHNIQKLEEKGIRKYIEGHYEGQCMAVME